MLRFALTSTFTQDVPDSSLAICLVNIVRKVDFFRWCRSACPYSSFWLFICNLLFFSSAWSSTLHCGLTDLVFDFFVFLLLVTLNISVYQIETLSEFYLVLNSFLMHSALNVDCFGFLAGFFFSSGSSVDCRDFRVCFTFVSFFTVLKTLIWWKFLQTFTVFCTLFWRIRAW